MSAAIPLDNPIKPPVKQAEFLGHPIGLTTLFFTEMWERFSYYGMRALLMLYMVAPLENGGLGWTIPKAAGVYGAYTFAVYFTTIPGGWIADNIIGARLAVLLGGIIIASGHFTMVFPSIYSFYTGLGLIVLGTGLLKPNVSAMVGSLYTPSDPRRDGGFSIFYMGINIGAFVAPLVCGYLAQAPSFKIFLTQYGFHPEGSWHWGFGAAGIGMTLGLIQYLVGAHFLGDIGKQPEKRNKIINATVEKSSAPLTLIEIKRLVCVIIFFAAASLFWAAFEQAGSSLSLFADKMVNNTIFGWSFPSSYWQSVNAIFIIAMAPVFSIIWTRWGNRQPSSPAKFSVGLLFAGLGFVVVSLAAKLVGVEKAAPMWLVVVYFLHTTGELCLSPVGLSTMTKLSPLRLVGLVMGIWFLAPGIGNYVGGMVAGHFDAADPNAVANLFMKVAVVTIVSAGVMAAITPYMKNKLMGGVK